MLFDLTQTERDKAWNHTIEELEKYYSETEQYRASIYPDRSDVTDFIIKDFNISRETNAAVNHVVRGLSEYAVHTPHPHYYGMFNPRTNFPSILADTITAVFNPQLAAWGHAPFAVEVERMLIHEFGKKFGFKMPFIDGVFTSGGQEANLTAVLCALNHKFPDYARHGVRAIPGIPVIYCSKSSHHSTVKAARVCGLGSDSIRYIEVNNDQQLAVEDLAIQIEKDLAGGFVPLMIIATLGTTGEGAIDQIDDIGQLSKEYNIWLHADAAYGGALMLTSHYPHLLGDLSLADSITFDAHKWLSVPMATSMFITKHTIVLGKAFSIQSNYMPNEEPENDQVSSYTHSIQWSRRFIGLKLYMSLLVFGWKGYDQTITHQVKMGTLLREKLKANQWKIINKSELPIICFTDPRFEEDDNFALFIYDSFLQTGEAWINKYPMLNLITLRTCITNYATNENHLDELIELLNKKRTAYVAHLNS